MANQTINVRIADPLHPNGVRTTGGVTFTRAWKTVTVSDANAELIAADPTLISEATAVVAEAMSGAIVAVDTVLGALLDGVDISPQDGEIILGRVAQLYRTPTTSRASAAAASAGAAGEVERVTGTDTAAAASAGAAVDVESAAGTDTAVAESAGAATVAA